MKNTDGEEAKEIKRGNGRTAWNSEFGRIREEGKREERGDQNHHRKITVAH